MKKLNALGIGPKIGRIAIPVFLLTLFLSLFYKDVFIISKLAARQLFLAGLVLLSVGLVFYGITVRLLLKGIRETRLITKGTYALSQNPLYASIILMILPAVALLLNSWLILITSLVAFLLLKKYITIEYEELDAFFGEEYRNYQMKTATFFPLPPKES